VEKIFDDRGDLLAAKKVNLLLGDSGANINDKVFKHRNYDEIGGLQGGKVGVEDGLLGALDER